MSTAKYLFCCLAFLALSAQAQWKRVNNSNSYGTDYSFVNDSVSFRIGMFSPPYPYSHFNWPERSVTFGNSYGTLSYKPYSPFILEPIKGDTILYCSARVGGSVELSYNGGQTWQVISCCSTHSIQSAYFLSSNYGMTIDSLGIVKRYFNGVTSTASSFPSSTTVKHLYIKDQARAFVIVNDKKLYATSDSGYTWTSILTRPYRLNRIFFPGPNIGYIACDSGKVLKTTNGGLSWTGLNTAISSNLNSVHFKNDTIGFCVGDFGSVLLTRNGGVNWTKEVIPCVDRLMRVAVTGKKAYASDANGYLYRRDIDTCDKVVKPSVSFSMSPLTGCSYGGTYYYTGAPATGTLVYPVGSGNIYGNHFYYNGTAGIKSAGYIITDSLTGCSNIATQDFTVFASQSLTLTASSYTTCYGTTPSTVTLVGYPSGGIYSGSPGTVNGGTLTASFGTSGTYQFNYSYTDPTTGCTSQTFASITVGYCAGIEEYQNDASLSVFPNPVQNELFINCTQAGSRTVRTVRIINSIGQKVYDSELFSDMLRIRTDLFAPGIYILIITDSDSRTFTRKIIKE